MGALSKLIIASAFACGAVVAQSSPPIPSLFGSNSPTKHKMKYRPLGNSGLRVSEISYGAWMTFGSKSPIAVIDDAKKMLLTGIEQGINFFDNAESYGTYHGESETIMGEALESIFNDYDPKLKDWKHHVERKDVVITTKLFRMGDGVNDKGLSRKHIMEGADASLKRLRMKYVDIIFAHRYDYSTPLEETVRAFNDLITQGKIFYWGTSEWSAEELTRAKAIADRLGLIPPLAEQPLYNMMFRERVEQEYKLLYSPLNLGLGVTAYSPLGEGILAGRYVGKEIPKDSRGAWKDKLVGRKDQIEFGDKLHELLEKDLKKNNKKFKDVTMAQLALAWCLKNERVSTLITGASKPAQLVSNVKAIEVVPLMTDEIMKKIDDLGTEVGGKFKPPKLSFTEKSVMSELTGAGRNPKMEL